MRPRILWMPLAFWAGLACGESQPKESAFFSLGAAVLEKGDTIRLPGSPSSLAVSGIPAETLKADLRLGGIQEGFGHLADVLQLDSGRFAVLDAMEARVLIFDSLGNAAGRFGGPGRGPGEFQAPWALARAGDKIVVWDVSPNRPFTAVTPNGNVLATFRQEIDGDWARIQFRHPLLKFDFPYQTTYEDLSLRLRGLSDSTFLHQLQPDELELFLDQGSDFPAEITPPVFLVRYHIAGTVLDTLRILQGAPLVRRRARSGRAPEFETVLFSGRPVWTTGRNWHAWGHGDSSVIHVRSASWDSLAIVWPRQRHRVEYEDRSALATWYFQQVYAKLPHTSETWRRSTREERQAKIGRLARQFTPAAYRPMVAALYGGGDCLWISGHDPRDNAFAISQTLIGFNVRTRALEAVVTIPRKGVRIRDVSASNIFASYSDELSVDFLERYPLPAGICGGKSSR